MFGTVARLKFKPGMEEAFSAYARELHIAEEEVASFVYRMEHEPGVCYLAVVFTDKEAYQRNAERPETQADYARMLEFLAEAPEWHDGAVIYSYQR